MPPIWRRKFRRKRITEELMPFYDFLQIQGQTAYNLAYMGTEKQYTKDTEAIGQAVKSLKIDF